MRDRLFALRITHRPIPHHSPHLTGKVEPTQKMVLREFYAATSLTSATLEDHVEGWLTDYTYRRVHGRLGVTPSGRWATLEQEMPSWDDVMAAFDPRKEMTYVERLTFSPPRGVAVTK